MTENELMHLNQGKMASFMLGELRPVFEEIKADCLTQMKNMYRDGTFTETKLVASVSQLCTLEDIENRLSGKALFAEGIQKKIDGNSKSESATDS